MPAVQEAMDLLKYEMQRAKCNKEHCMLIIHGYGSTGKGGIICKKARQWPKAQERKSAFKAVVFGEDFNIYNETARFLKNRYADPTLQNLMRSCNHGVTVVQL